MKVKVRINEVIRESPKNFVIFSTEYGNTKAFWNGDMPEVDKEYFVELEIESTLKWGDNIRIVEDDKYVIGVEGNACYMVGYLESIEDDGYTVIRLGENIISLEVDGKPFPIGVFVKVEADKVILFNINY